MLNTPHRITEKGRLFCSLTSVYVKATIEAFHMAASNKNTILAAKYVEYFSLYGLTIIKMRANTMNMNKDTK